MKVKSPTSRPPVAFDYEEEQDDHDHDDGTDADDANSTCTDKDDEIPIFSSPLEHDEVVPAVATPSEESDQPSTPVVVAPIDPVATTTPHPTPPPRSPVKDTEFIPTLAEPSAMDKSDMTKQTTIPSHANPITPSLKEKGPPNKKMPKTKRLGLAEQTHQSSLQLAQKLLQYTETTCKTLHDEYKRSQKVVKRLQQQLQEAQSLQQQWQTQLDEALKNKKDAAKEVKTLTRLWEKYTTSEQKKELLRKGELTILKKEAMLKRRVVGEDETDALQPPNKKRNQGDRSSENGKKHKTKTSKKGKAKEDSSDDDESSDSEADQRNSSEDDDSDWEGARRIRCPGPTATTTVATTTSSVGGMDTNKRTSGRRKACTSKEWSCPTCTLLNPPDMEECDACGTPK